MGYAGKASVIVLGQTGLNYNPNLSLIPPNAPIWPTRNLDMHNGRLETRGGTAKDNDTAVSGSPRIRSIFDFRNTSGSRFQVFATADGKVWSNSTTTLKSGMSTSNPFAFETFDNNGTRTLFITDGATRPQMWDGSAGSTSDITTIPTDWTGSNFPAQIIRHQVGQGSCGVALGFPGLPKNIYITPPNQPTNYGDADVQLLYCDTGDSYGLIGGVEFGERFFAFGKERAFYLDDTDLNSDNWFFVPAQFRGGVAHWRLLVKTDNDLIAMMQDGSIYSVSSALQFGDYRLANLTKPAFIDRWIRDNVNLARIDDFHAVYDPTKRVVMFFVVRTSKTEVDTAIKFYVDRDPADAWMIDDQPNFDSGYKASCSARVESSTGTFRIYTGDYDGFIWKLGEPICTDDGNAYYSGVHLPYSDSGFPGINKDFPRFWVNGRSNGAYTIPFNWWVDAIKKTSGEISLTSNVSKFGSAKFGTAKFAGSDDVEVETDLGDSGKRIKLELYTNTAGRKLSLSSARIDFKPLGAAAQ